LIFNFRIISTQIISQTIKIIFFIIPNQTNN
jgi:hypothetical protein